VIRRMGATLVAVTVLAGCGGDKDEPATVETKADFIAAGDRICHKRDQRSLKLTDADELTTAGLATQLADIYGDSVRELQAVALPPGAARAGAQRYVEAVANLRRPAERMGMTAEALGKATTEAEIKRLGTELQGNINTVGAINDLADLHARNYGFKVCGKQQPPTMPST